MIDQKIHKVIWSYSKRDLLRQCLRRYYFNYYGANKKTAKNEQRKDQIRFLKGITNRYMRTGQILHLAIKTYFKKSNVYSYGDNGLIKWASDIFKKDIKYSSLDENDRLKLTFNYQPSILLEYFYKQEDAEKKCMESLERLENALHNFINYPKISKLHQLANDKDTIIEESIRIKKNNFNASGKVDFSFKKDGKIYILDWKISGDEIYDESLQLAFYGMWAMEENQYDPENIKLYKICLSDFRIIPFPFNFSSYNRTKARLIQDIEKMFLLDIYGKNANYNVFSKCYPSKICEFCQYQGICRED